VLLNKEIEHQNNFFIYSNSVNMLHNLCESVLRTHTSSSYVSSVVYVSS
jgi:hypothetical protein